MKPERANAEKADNFLAFSFLLPSDTPPPEVPTDDCSYGEYDTCKTTPGD